jgi:hypothetical protein
MEDLRVIVTRDHRDDALRRIARMFGHLGRWSEAREAVSAIHDGRVYAALRVLKTWTRSGSATDRAAMEQDELLDIVQIACQSLSGTIGVCAALSEGPLAFDDALERSVNRLVTTVTERAEAIVSTYFDS